MWSTCRRPQWSATHTMPSFDLGRAGALDERRGCAETAREHLTVGVLGPHLLSPAKDAVVGGDVRCMADCLSPHACEATCSLVADSDRLATIARTKKEGQGGECFGVAELTATKGHRLTLTLLNHEHGKMKSIMIILAIQDTFKLLGESAQQRIMPLILVT